MSAKKETRDLLRAAQRQGFEVERTRRSGHFKITPPNPGASVVFAASTPSDHAAYKLLRSRLRRAGFVG